MMYAGYKGIPYAAIGMVGVVVAVLGYATFEDSAYAIASSINQGISVVSEKIGESVSFIKKSSSDIAENVANKTEELSDGLTDMIAASKKSTTIVGDQPEQPKQNDNEREERYEKDEEKEAVEKKDTSLLGGKRKTKRSKSKTKQTTKRRQTVSKSSSRRKLIT